MYKTSKYIFVIVILASIVSSCRSFYEPHFDINDLTSSDIVSVKAKIATDYSNVIGFDVDSSEWQGIVSRLIPAKAITTRYQPSDTLGVLNFTLKDGTSIEVVFLVTGLRDRKAIIFRCNGMWFTHEENSRGDISAEIYEILDLDYERQRAHVKPAARVPVEQAPNGT